MILYEYEGKKLLSDAGIAVPKSFLVTKDSLNEIAASLAALAPRNDGVILKAQVLSGKRAEAGGIVKVPSSTDLVPTPQSGASRSLKELFGKTINKEKVEKVLVEEMVEYSGPEYYVSCFYDTDSRGPVLTISESGGTGVEERGVQSYPIDPLTQSVILGTSEARIPESDSGQARMTLDSDVIEKLIKLFFDQDLLLLEINPLVWIPDQVGDDKGGWVALDAKVKLEDNAMDRHKDWEFPPRSAPGHTPTKNEIEAKKIDEGDYRGVAGSTYFDLDGDIAILASGGGASLTAMDALLKAGGKPANYTEYGGNPPREKVEKLTRVVLSKPGIHGLWVVGAVANFTDIYETLSGFVEGLRNLKKEGVNLDIPIVIRRGGPRDKEAFEMLRQVKDFDLHLYGEETSIAESAKIMAELAQKYASTN